MGSKSSSPLNLGRTSAHGGPRRRAFSAKYGQKSYNDSLVASPLKAHPEHPAGEPARELSEFSDKRRIFSAHLMVAIQLGECGQRPQSYYSGWLFDVPALGYAQNFSACPTMATEIDQNQPRTHLEPNQSMTRSHPGLIKNLNIAQPKRNQSPTP